MSESDTYQRILAVETATRVQSVALIDGDELLEHRQRRVAYNHGSSLLKTIDTVFDGRDIELADIDLFAVGIGPGSFTGTRVGLADAKALSRAVETPIVGVSSLAALAYQPARISPGATVIAAIDARRREVYAGAYRFEEGELKTVLDDRAASPDDWRTTVEEQLSGELIQVGNGVERYDVLADWELANLDTIPTDLVAPSAVGVAQLGRHIALDEGPHDRVNLQPNYIRPSDAVLPDKPLGEMPEEPEEL